MAANLAKVFPTKVFDMNGDAVAAAVKRGCVGAEHVQEVYSSDCIVTCLPNSRIVRSVVDQFLTHEVPTKLWLDLTSGDPEESRAIHRDLAARGIMFVDAGMSGGPAGAEAASLTLMVGGDAGAVELVTPLLERISATIIPVGPAGAGHTVKCVNNALLAANLWNAFEAMDMLKRNGVPLDLAFDAINASSGHSECSKRVARHVLTGKFDFGFSLGLLRKDIGIFTKLCRPESTIRDVEKQYALAADLLGNDVDHMRSVALLQTDDDE